MKDETEEESRSGSSFILHPSSFQGGDPMLTGTSSKRCLRSPRRGTVGMIVLMVMPVLLLTAILALAAAELTEAGTDARVSADAAALAGVQVLVDDRVLIGQRSDMLNLLSDATAEAQRYGGLNPVLGMPLEFQANPENDPNGDIVFGTIDNIQQSRTMVVADVTNPKNQNLPSINALRLQSRRGMRILHGPFLARGYSEVHVIATGFLDHDVIGFRPVDNQPIPLAPIALLSDPSAGNKDSWEYQVEKQKGTDQWHWDRNRQQMLPGPDGLFEMTVTKKNASLLQLGTNDLTGLAQQLIVGVTAAQLQNVGGQLILGGNNNTLIVPGTPWQPGSGANGSGYLLQVLQQLQAQGQPRIWPLYSGYDSHTQMPILRGFVAARVANVDVDGNGSKTSFTLQPCLLAVASAVTDASHRGGGVPTRYLCKVRLVE
jgi:hypothetical protein